MKPDREEIKKRTEERIKKMEGSLENKINASTMRAVQKATGVCPY